MKKKNSLLVTAILVMTVIWSFILLLRNTEALNGIDVFIFILIVGVGIVALVRAFKKHKEQKEGQPDEDEFSNLIKYKSGYQAYLASMYVWLFIFFFKAYFPDIETMLGLGILVSAAIGFITKLIVKRQINAE
jgi:Ca2+/Na+ antiporter